MKYDQGEKILNTSNIIQCILMILIGSAMFISGVWVIFFETIPKALTGFNFLFGFIGVFGSIMIVVYIHELFYGKLYKAIGYIPVTEFKEVNNYANGIIFVVNNYAWKFFNAKDEIAKLESIEFIQYFDIKGESVQYVLTPYNQLRMK